MSTTDNKTILIDTNKCSEVVFKCPCEDCKCENCKCGSNNNECECVFKTEPLKWDSNEENVETCETDCVCDDCNRKL